MRKSAKVITALSVTGLAVVAGSAFTGAGLSTAGQASSAQFVGGTVSQNVDGATLTSVVYGFTDGTKTAVDEVTLTFTDAAGGRTPDVTLAGGTVADFTCTAIDADLFTSVCTIPLGGSQSGVTGASVTVPDAV